MRMDDDRIVGYERIFNTLCGRERELFNALKAERKESKELQAQVIALQNKPCCLCPHLQAKLEALKPYIRHKSPCEFKTVGLSKCACGLLQALEQKK